MQRKWVGFILTLLLPVSALAVTTPEIRGQLLVEKPASLEDSYRVVMYFYGAFNYYMGYSMADVNENGDFVLAPVKLLEPGRVREGSGIAVTINAISNTTGNFVTVFYDVLPQSLDGLASKDGNKFSIAYVQRAYPVTVQVNWPGGTLEDYVRKILEAKPKLKALVDEKRATWELGAHLFLTYRTGNTVGDFQYIRNLELEKNRACYHWEKCWANESMGNLESLKMGFHQEPLFQYVRGEDATDVAQFVAAIPSAESNYIRSVKIYFRVPDDQYADPFAEVNVGSVPTHRLEGEKKEVNIRLNDPQDTKLTIWD